MPRDEACAAGGDQEQREAGEDQERERKRVGVPRAELVEGLVVDGRCGSLAACFLAASVSELVSEPTVPFELALGLTAVRLRVAARLLPGGHDVLDDAGVDPQVLGDVRDRLAVAVERVGRRDPAVVDPVVDDLLPAGRLGRRRLGGDPERKHGQGGNDEHGDGSDAGGSDSSRPTCSGA